ncbi:low temperature responsive protein [Scheffersomyces spartinae]|uniref:Protein LOT5 n=1 Tax=Scheffersomyces spartinae TaxID=45513 RepID=A0A9P7VDA3_9ASCO|nr:low temperature responsive protein [Scheffersomyces spartinae]KAG7195729.1 low temperature responsive protein [Scheffersomyces spartinae]
MEVFNSNPQVTIEFTSGVHEEHRHVSVFALDSFLILWFNQSHRGLTIPYDRIIFHSVRNEGSQLYLQVEANEIIRAQFKSPLDYTPSVELVIEVDPGDPIVRHGIFGDGNDNNVFQLYEAITVCSDNHVTEAEEEDNSNAMAAPIMGEAPIGAPLQYEAPLLPAGALSNGGDADDLESSEMYRGDSNDAAGMDVDVECASIAGTVRSLGSDEGSYRMTKQRRIL